jgi:hypothetical protein
LCSFFARFFKDYGTCFAARSRAGAADVQKLAAWLLRKNNEDESVSNTKDTT